MNADGVTSSLLPPEGYYDRHKKPRAYGGGGGRGRGGGGRHHDREEASVGYVRREGDGEPLHELKVLPDRPIAEEEVGIKCHASSNVPGFSAIVKHLYSDVNVNEVTPEDEVVRMRSTEITQVEEDRKKVELESLKEEDFPEYADLGEEERRHLPRLTFVRVQQLAKKYLGSKVKSAPSDAVIIEVSICYRQSTTFVSRAAIGTLISSLGDQAGERGEEGAAQGHQEQVPSPPDANRQSA